MNCARCGSWQPGASADNRFCSQCGAALPDPVYYADPGYHDVIPALTAEPTAAMPRPPAPQATGQHWLRHPGTWVIAATALLVAGIVLAAVIIAGSGSDDRSNQAAANSSPTTSAASTSAPPSTSAAPPTQTVIVVPAAPGSPEVTRTVTVPADPPEPDESSGPFAGADEVSADYYRSGNTVYFDSPSHNISCRLVSGGAQAQCTIKEYEFSEPGYDCDIGAGVLMNVGSSPVIDCIYSEPYSGEPVLDYGEYVVFGDFACVSRSAGITCLDAYDSGFTLSREAYYEE